jgi:hypothetical protein
MNSFRKSRNYFIKCFGLVLLLGFISLGAVGGCSNNDGGQDSSRAITENDFAEDSSLSALAGGGVVVHFLEPPGDSQTAQRDTGGTGDDVIPIRYNQTSEHTLCWEDDNEEASHFMTLVDSVGQEVLSVGANGDCVTQIIERGNYEMRLHHDGTHPIFIQPVSDDQAAGNTATEQGIIKTAERIFEETLRYIRINNDARAQTVQQNIETLIKTRSCNDCDLKKANLSNRDLSSVMLLGADLTQANLIEANLSGASMAVVNFMGAVLSGANLNGTDLNNSTMNGANLSEADLTTANLADASLKRVILNNTNFSRAIWCAGTCYMSARFN